jgi:hypothetical protein
MFKVKIKNNNYKAIYKCRVNIKYLHIKWVNCQGKIYN